MKEVLGLRRFRENIRFGCGVVNEMEKIDLIALPTPGDPR